MAASKASCATFLKQRIGNNDCLEDGNVIYSNCCNKENDNYGTDIKFLGIINKMGDLKLDVSFPNHDYEELNNKFEILRHDFLYNLKVISEKEQLIQKVQRMLEASETLLQKKENELLEIKKECENLSKAQEELCNAYSDLRKTFPTSVAIQDSRENNISEESTVRINNDVRNHPYKFQLQPASTRESKLQEQITILEKQLNESTEQNSRLQDQTLLLRQKFKHSTSIYKNELYELKKTQNSVLEQHKDSKAMCLKAKEEIMHLKNVLNLIISLITASRTALKLKNVNLSFQQKANVTTADIYEFIKAFINEIIQKINEYQALSESLQTQLTGNIRENDMIKNYKEKFTQQEKELYKTKQQNSILINVIKEMKQFGKITLDAQKYDPINDHISDPPTGKTFNVQKRESGLTVSHENEPNDTSVTMCNAEKILMTLNKQIENLVQKGHTDEEGEYQIEKLEHHLSRVKNHLLHQLQEKIIDVEKQESVPSGNIGFCNVRLMLLEEKINQLSSEIISEVACGKELLIETLKDIKTELAGLQRVCQNLKITSNKPNKEKDEMEVIDFRTEIDIEKFKRLEEKVYRLELCVQQKSRATQEHFVSNTPGPLQKFPLEVVTPPHSQHFKDTKFPTSFQAERKYHEMYSSQENIPFQCMPTHLESARVPKSKQDSDISIGNTSSDHTHIDYIWNELNEEHTTNILNGKF